MKKSIKFHRSFNSNRRLDLVKVKTLQVQLFKRNRDIAAETGIPQWQISRHILGDGRFPDVQEAIAKSLGVNLTDILLKPEETEKPLRASKKNSGMKEGEKVAA